MRVPLHAGLMLALVMAACGGSGDDSKVDTGETQDPGTVEDPGTDTVEPAPVKVDLLLVVDDSTSMCEEQRTLSNMFDALAALGSLNLRLAVTTTNVCSAGATGAVRGRFVYQPAKSLPPTCTERRVVACMTDADCQGDTSLPDAQNWVCDGTTADNLYTCDSAPDPIVLWSVRSTCRYSCTKDDDTCGATFGYGASCDYPGGAPTLAGCRQPLGTEACPEDGPTVLDSGVVEQYLAAWKGGNWSGVASWTGKTDDEVRPLIWDLLFRCLTFVGADQAVCANQEQGMRAAWLALDPQGENATQAAAFHRADATLVVVIVSDEDDCSAPDKCSRRDPSSGGILTDVQCVLNESVARCACLRDENGCLPGQDPNQGECEPAECLVEGTFVRGNCPLEPAGSMADNLKSLKADPAKVFFVAVTGDVIPESTTTPGTDVAAAKTRYAECKCDKYPSRSPFTYVCSSAAGKADLGSRYHALAAAFGDNGKSVNICDGDGISLGLATAIQAVLSAGGE